MSRTAHDILVVSPDQKLARSILTALAETAVVRDVRLETDYPATEVLKDLLSPVDHPITAVIVAVSKREQDKLEKEVLRHFLGRKVNRYAASLSREPLRPRLRACLASRSVPVLSRFVMSRPALSADL